MSPEAVHIQREPIKEKIVERRDKVNSEYIKEFISQNEDYFLDPVTVYDKGVDPMRSMMYTNPAQRGGSATASGRFDILTGGEFRPPLQTATDLLPLWKKRSDNYIAYETMPEFKAYLKNISCQPDLQKIMRHTNVSAQVQTLLQDPYNRSYVQTNAGAQVVKTTPLDVHGMTSKQTSIRAQQSSQIYKTLADNVDASFVTNKGDQVRTLRINRGIENYGMRDHVQANAKSIVKGHQDTVQYGGIDDKRYVQERLDVNGDINKGSTSRKNNITYIGDTKRYEEEKAPETTYETYRSSTNKTGNIKPESVHMNQRLERYSSDSIQGFRAPSAINSNYALKGRR
jgi:hypothetical protein